jgi:hypothetical protein
VDEEIFPGSGVTPQTLKVLMGDSAGKSGIDETVEDDPLEQEIDSLNEQKKTLTIAVGVLGGLVGLLLVVLMGLWWRGRKNEKKYTPLNHSQAMKDESFEGARYKDFKSKGDL